MRQERQAEGGPQEEGQCRVDSRHATKRAAWTTVLQHCLQPHSAAAGHGMHVASAHLRAIVYGRRRMGRHRHLVWQVERLQRTLQVE